jgi:dihydrofolate reductase
MKVLLYITLTANGCFSRENHDISYISDEVISDLKNIIKKTGNVILGRKAYEVLSKKTDFLKKEDPMIFVISKNTTLTSDNLRVNYVTFGPKRIIEFIEEDDYDKTLILGGSKTASLFIKENLVDEIYINIEPFLLGNGTKFFCEYPLEKRLELISTNKISNNVVQLHYRVLK